jgi:hypothetical protein
MFSEKYVSQYTCSVGSSQKFNIQEINSMRIPLIVVCALSSAVLSVSAVAAKPVKITPDRKGDANGTAFRNYIVECSNGKRQALTSWDSGKKWCIGESSQANCAKKQIKAAKSACKLD